MITTARLIDGSQNDYNGANPLPVKSGVDGQAAIVGGAAASVAAPGAGAAIVDTGQLAAGTYRVEIVAAFADTLAAGKALLVQHRNAANGANIWELPAPAGQPLAFTIERLVVADNERVRVINGAVAGAAGSIASALIRCSLLNA
jgi:hypothetical protein